MQVNKTKVTLNLLPAPKTNLNNADIKKILPYSAMNSNANPTLPYSILNPDTSSDSPSAKSKGVRLVSAKEIINHRPKRGKNIIIFVQ